MRMRLYGGGGHERTVYLPFGLNAAPPYIFLPAIAQVDVDLMRALDPDNPEVHEVTLCYYDSGVNDPDGARRYIFEPGDAK